MKKIITLISIATSLFFSSCSNHQIYTLSTLDKVYYNDIDITQDWKVVLSNGKTEYITDRPHKIGDTIEIVHTDNTASKYILTAIK